METPRAFVAQPMDTSSSLRDAGWIVRIYFWDTTQVAFRNKSRQDFFLSGYGTFNLMSLMFRQTTSLIALVNSRVMGRLR
jgi:hypothetical protein